MKVTYETNDDDRNQCIPSGVGLKVGIVGEFSSIHPLRLHALVEANVGETYPEPSHEACYSCHVGEPVENLARASFDTHEAKEHKARVE